MKYGELAAVLKQFKADLTQHRSLYRESLDSTIPEFPIRNGERLQQPQATLTRELYLLEPFLQRFAHQRSDITPQQALAGIFLKPQ
jgi:hypothetical protein